ncbi:zona pellucida sperm-binding protein 1-like [Antennarius striatus]|uniref:zona pellucida sperm-binding protein 1-like n=1 Tax=Antennarius striatus TaxID=241820 RepID=UPI0035B1031E
MFCQTVAHVLGVYGIQPIQQDGSAERKSSSVRSPTLRWDLCIPTTFQCEHQLPALSYRLMVECGFPPGSPDHVWLHVMDQTSLPVVQSTPATVQLKIATDESFTNFHPEAHLPLSLIRGRAVYAEVSLSNPPQPDLKLLVHSCLAYIPAPFNSWVTVYDGCSTQGDSQLLLSPHTDHIRRIIISSFLLLPSESPAYVADEGNWNLDDREVFFMCLTDVCSAADGCAVGCSNSKFNIMETQRRSQGVGQ